MKPLPVGGLRMSTGLVVRVAADRVGEMAAVLTVRAQARAIREALAVDVALTTVQLERRGWLAGLDGAGVVVRDLAVRVKAAHPGGERALTFVTLTARPIDDRALVHYAMLGEMRCLLPQLRPRVPDAPVGEGWAWRVVTDRREGAQVDAEVRCGGAARAVEDWAVEMDTGYPVRRVEEKLRRIGQEYRRLLWPMSVAGRMERVRDIIRTEDDAGRLGLLEQVVIRHVDISSDGNPYARFPVNRNHKPVTLHYSTRSAGLD